MPAAFAVGAGLAALPALAWTVLHLRRRGLYRRLRAQHAAIRAAHPDWRVGAPPVDFATGCAVVPDALPAADFARLLAVGETCRNPERSWIPAHKQGGTIAYESLHALAPELVGFFLSNGLRQWVSATVGEAVLPTPVHDQSSCSLLRYSAPRDRIGWHYDHNFYRGRHFTVLLVLANRREDEPTALSDCRLHVRLGQQDVVIEDRPNTLIVFEGARIRHCASALGPGQFRLLLSMTFATRLSASPAQAVARRCKDVAFYGLRALWT